MGWDGFACIRDGATHTMSAGPVAAAGRTPATAVVPSRLPAAPGPAPARTSRPGRLHAVAPRLRWIAVGALLATYVTMSFTASLSKGVSFDEGQQLAVGYNLWLRDDYRIEGANGDLVKRWATLPYLWTRPHFVGTDDPMWLRAEPYEVAHRFFFELGNQPELLLAQGRAMMALLGAATGLMIFFGARALFGWRSAFVALGLFCFSPHMLAFGGIVSTDLSITLTLPAATWCIWRLLHTVTAGRVLLSGAVFGLLLLAKMTALVIFPITIALIAIRSVAGGPMTLRWGGRSWRIALRHQQALLVLALVVFHAVAGWSAIWAHYGFRYVASPNPADPRIALRVQTGRDRVPNTLQRLVTWSRESKFLPQGYCQGIDWLLGDDDRLPAFMDGKTKRGGWRTFFPYAIWVKTQPTLFVLLALGGFAWWRVRRRDPGGAPTGAVPGLYAAAPHLVLIIVYLAVAVTEDINLGHRHVLPIYPSLYILASAAVLLWGRRAPWITAAVAGLLVWRVADSLATRPNYLSYFGPQAGGTESGYKHLVDSSLDWGMNLPALKHWLDVHNPGNAEPVFLSYFGTDSPEYHGIKSRRLPGFFDRRPKEPYPLQPGIYAISATLFQGIYLAAHGPWNAIYETVYRRAIRNIDWFESTAHNPAARADLLQRRPLADWANDYVIHDHFRLARLCAWLRHQGEPPHHVGHAIFIWKLDRAALEAAVLGPPVELEEPSPAVRRQFGLAEAAP